MKELHITREHDNQRLDKFLRAHFATLPLSVIYKLLRKKKIVLNSKKADPSARIAEGDTITCKFLPSYIEKLESESKEKKDAHITYAKPTFTVLYEDEHLLIVDKPSGVPAHGGSDTGSNTLINQVLTYLKYSSDSEAKPALVHRLDKDTSGIVIIGKRREVVVGMNELIKQRKIHKRYYAMVKGNITPSSGTITTRLEKSDEGYRQQKMHASTEGRSAVTKYKTDHIYAGYSLLSLVLITGRTHQIRAHLSHMGQPIICDERYGDFEDNKQWKKRTGLKRQFLHAYEVQFVHPITTVPLRIRSPLPDDLQSVIRYLEQ